MKCILESFESIWLLLKTYLLNNRFWQQRAWSTHCHCIPVDSDNWGNWLESALTKVCFVIKFQLVHEILDLVGHRLVICSFKGIDKTNIGDSMFGFIIAALMGTASTDQGLLLSSPWTKIRYRSPSMLEGVPWFTGS